MFRLWKGVDRRMINIRLFNWFNNKVVYQDIREETVEKIVDILNQDKLRIKELRELLTKGYMELEGCTFEEAKKGADEIPADELEQEYEWLVELLENK